MKVPSIDEIARRATALKKPGWTFDGARWRKGHPGGEIEIAEHFGSHRVTVIPGDRTREALWDAPNLAEAFEIAELAIAVLQEQEAWESHHIPQTTADLGDGLTVVVRKRAGGQAEAGVLGRDGTVKGRFTFVLTGWPAAFILGEPTVNGSVWIDEDIRGMGICRAIYDTVESACGYKVVPHGRNFVNGALNRMSTGFWDKRTAERQVPGHGDPDAEERRLLVEKAVRFVAAEGSAMDPEFALAVSSATGWQIRGALTPGQKIPHTAWCRAGEGIGFGPMGYFEEADLLPKLGETPVSDFEVSQIKQAIGSCRISGFFMIDTGKEAERAELVMERYSVPRIGPGDDPGTAFAPA